VVVLDRALRVARGLMPESLRLSYRSRALGPPCWGEMRGPWITYQRALKTPARPVSLFGGTMLPLISFLHRDEVALERGQESGTLSRIASWLQGRLAPAQPVSPRSRATAMALCPRVYAGRVANAEALHVCAEWGLAQWPSP